MQIKENITAPVTGEFPAQRASNAEIFPFMLGLHRTPEGLGTDLQPKNGQTRGYSGAGRQGRMFLQSYSPEGHKLLLNTRNNSGLLAIEIDELHDCFYPSKTVSSTSMASDPSRKSLQVGRNFTRWPRMSLGTVVNRSQVTLEIFISCSLLPSDTCNTRRSRPGHRSVVNWSHSITDQLEVGRKCITAVGSWLWFWGPSLCR